MSSIIVDNNGNRHRPIRHHEEKYDFDDHLLGALGGVGGGGTIDGGLNEIIKKNLKKSKLL